MSEPLRVLVLAKYGSLGASSRLRILQYLPLLREAGLEVTVQPLLSDELLQARYRDGGYGLFPLVRAYADRCRVLLRRRHFDLVWIEKEALPWWPLWFESALLRGVPYALDYDDAVFHNYDRHANLMVRRVFGRRIDGLMAGAALVVRATGIWRSVRLLPARDGWKSCPRWSISNATRTVGRLPQARRRPM